MKIKKITEADKVHYHLLDGDKLIADAGLLAHDKPHMEFANNVDIEALKKCSLFIPDHPDVDLIISHHINIEGLLFNVFRINIKPDTVSVEICYFPAPNFNAGNFNRLETAQKLQEFGINRITFSGAFETHELNEYFLQWRAKFEGGTDFDKILKEINTDFSELIRQDGAVKGLAFNDTYKKDEILFIRELLIPMFQLLGFQSVRFNHGNQEFGKDITFFDINRLGRKEYWGVQVKVGDVSGRANSKIDELISQINDMAQIPFKDIDTSSNQYLSKVIVAISGEFKENAKEKIIRRIPLQTRNHVHFIDQWQIETLMSNLQKELMS